jgi:MFS family permease
MHKSPHEHFSAQYRNYVLALLTLGYLFNFVDRQVMTILLEPIKNEFGVTDTHMGFLSGLAFALFYATLGVPVARLADNWSRRNVLAISMTIWSAVTALCGMAGNFWQLAALRIGVGVGEAGGVPPSQSLLADYFPPEKRSLALGVLAAAPNVGILVGLFGGAIIAEAYGWRAVFVVFGAPGVLLAILLFFTVKEPPKIPRPTVTGKDSLWRTVRKIYAIPAFPYISIAVGFTAISGYGFGVWSPSFLIRVHGVSIVDAGLYLGLIGAIGGGLGTVLGGYVCDKLAARNPVWQLRLPAVGILLALPLQIAFLLWPEQDTFLIAGKVVPTAILFMAASSVFAGCWIGPTYAAVQNLVPPYWRTQASALLLLAFNLLGMGLGPLLVGLLSDTLAASHAENSIRYALLYSLVTVVVGATLYLLGNRHYVAHIRQAD